ARSGNHSALRPLWPDTFCPYASGGRCTRIAQPPDSGLDARSRDRLTVKSCGTDRLFGAHGRRSRSQLVQCLLDTLVDVQEVGDSLLDVPQPVPVHLHGRVAGGLPGEVAVQALTQLLDFLAREPGTKQQPDVP